MNWFREALASAKAYNAALPRHCRLVVAKPPRDPEGVSREDWNACCGVGEGCSSPTCTGTFAAARPADPDRDGEA